jgi:hypothetical protein
MNALADVKITEGTNNSEELRRKRTQIEYVCLKSRMIHPSVSMFVANFETFDWLMQFILELTRKPKYNNMKLLQTNSIMVFFHSCNFKNINHVFNCSPGLDTNGPIMTS